MFILSRKEKVKIKRFSKSLKIIKTTHIEKVKFSLSILALFTFVLVPNIYSADKTEIKDFCRRTSNYYKCIEDFEGFEKTISKPSIDSPIEIEVIPFQS